MSSTAIPPLELIPYQYESLPTPTSFRLLSVIPDRLNTCEVKICDQPIIACLLKVFDLQQAPHYNALSYTWGNPRIVPDSRHDATQKWPISVNGRLTYISRNLYDVLQHLKRQVEVLDKLDRKQRPENKTIVAKEADIDQRREPYYKTLLIEAAEEGRTGDVERFLSKGASVQCQDGFGETALHYAAENGHSEVVELLLHYKASHSILDSTNRTPLDCCLQRKRGQWEYVQWLLTKHTRSDGKDLDPVQTLSQIWIDAVCIDQDNIIERNAQVAMMSLIYRSASKVIVWLGIMDSDTITEAMTVARLSSRDEWAAIDPTDRKTLQNLLERHTWFRRKWVAQELALAKKVEIYCGRFVFDWEVLAKAALLDLPFVASCPYRAARSTRALKYGYVGRLEPGALILARLWSIVNPEAHIAVRSEVSIYREMREHEPLKWQTFKSGVSSLCSMKPTLSQLVIMTWGLDTTDPRDKIFALLSMARDPPPVVVNYRKPTHQVFLELGQKFVEAELDAGHGSFCDLVHDRQKSMLPLEGLTFVQPALCARNHFEKGEQLCSLAREWPDLPSWVPNFGRNLHDMRIHRPCFRACGATTSKSYPLSSSVLKLDALLVDEIATVEGLPPEISYKDSIHMPNEPFDVSSWLAMTLAMDPIYVTREPREEVLFRTLNCNLIKQTWKCKHGDAAEQNEARKRYRKSFKQFICHYLSPKYAKYPIDETVFEILDALCETSQSYLLPTRSEVELYDHKDYDRTNFENSFSTILSLYVNTRGLFITDRGYLGNGFNTAQPGDQIWLFAGAKVPFVLRKIPGTDRFCMIGEAYVHGLMFGEGVTDDKLDQFQPIEIQ